MARFQRSVNARPMPAALATPGEPKPRVSFVHPAGAFIDGGVRRKKMLLSRLDRGVAMRGVAMAFLCVDCFQRREA